MLTAKLRMLTFRAILRQDGEYCAAFLFAAVVDDL